MQQQQQFVDAQSPQQQQFFDARLPREQEQLKLFEVQQKDLGSYLVKLKDLVDKGGNTKPIWSTIFGMINMKTVLSEKDQKLLHKIFSIMARSPHRQVFLQDFMSQVKKSTLKHPRITKHFLRQVFPVERFPKSIHRFSHLSLFGPIIDYIRFLLFKPPTKKFQKQLVQFIGDYQDKQLREMMVNIDQFLPLSIRKEMQKSLLRQKQRLPSTSTQSVSSTSSSQKQQQQQSVSSTSSSQKQQQQSVSSTSSSQKQQLFIHSNATEQQIIKKINTIIATADSDRYDPQFTMKRFVQIFYLLFLLRKNKDTIENLYPVVKHFLKQNRIDRQSQQQYTQIVYRQGPHFQQIYSQPTRQYFKQTNRLIEQARKQQTKPLSLDVLMIISLLGLKTHMTEKDLLFVFDLVMKLRKEKDPRWIVFYDHTSKIVLEKARQILKNKKEDPKQIEKDLKYIEEILEKIKNNSKWWLASNYFSIKSILTKVGFQGLLKG